MAWSFLNFTIAKHHIADGYEVENPKKILLQLTAINNGIIALITYANGYAGYQAKILTDIKLNEAPQRN